MLAIITETCYCDIRLMYYNQLALCENLVSSYNVNLGLKK